MKKRDVRKEHWFNDNCVWRKTKTALRKFTENNDDDSRIHNCECRKKYKQTIENKREEW
jgi:uncharacterized Fe-S cluster-containing MiaB family protein